MSEKELLYEKALCILKNIHKPNYIEIRGVVPYGDSRADIIESPDELYECIYRTGGLKVNLYIRKEYFSRKKNVFFSERVVRMHHELEIKLNKGSFKYEGVYKDKVKIEKVVKELIRIQTIYIEDLDKRRLEMLNSIKCGD